MDNLTQPSVELITWSQVRDAVATVVPELAGLIDTISPNHDYPLVRARYRYGDKIECNGKFYITLDNESMPIDDERVPLPIRKAIGYSSTVPLGLLLRRTIESYVDLGDRTLLHHLLKPGELFSLFDLFRSGAGCSSGRYWRMNSGSQAIFMLPKISDMSFHKRLRRDYGLLSGVPESLFEQGVLFAELANSPCFEGDWYSEVLYFSEPWVKALQSNQWPALAFYMLKFAWKRSQFWSELPIYESFISKALIRYHQKLNPYMVDTAKHVMAISTGSSTGHQVAIDENVAPIRGIQQAYIESYSLKIYAPIIMQPAYLNDGPGSCVYYSLQYPMLTETTQIMRKVATKLEDLRELRQLFNLFVAEIKNFNHMVNATPLERFINQVAFEFYHSDRDRFGEISSCTQLPEQDSLLAQELARFPGRKLSERAQFLRGCVRISSQEHYEQNC